MKGFLLVLVEVVEHFLHFRLAPLEILKLDFQSIQLEGFLDDFRLDLLLLDFLLFRARVGKVLLIDGEHLLLVDLSREALEVRRYVLNCFAEIREFWGVREA